MTKYIEFIHWKSTEYKEPSHYPRRQMTASQRKEQEGVGSRRRRSRKGEERMNYDLYFTGRLSWIKIHKISVFVLSVDRPMPPKKDLTNTLNVSHRWEAFQLWTLLKGVFPKGMLPQHLRTHAVEKLSALWENIHSKFSSQKMCYKAS